MAGRMHDAADNTVHGQHPRQSAIGVDRFDPCAFCPSAKILEKPKWQAIDCGDNHCIGSKGGLKHRCHCGQVMRFEPQQQDISAAQFARVGCCPHREIVLACPIIEAKPLPLQSIQRRAPRQNSGLCSGFNKPSGHPTTNCPCSDNRYAHTGLLPFRLGSGITTHDSPS